MKESTSAPEPAVGGGAAETTAAATTAAARFEHAFDAATTAHDVAVSELRRLIALWLSHEPGARAGQDPEELHQLRVAARRIDATLGLFKRQLPEPLLRARKTTKALLRSLGAVRDLDVQLQELAEYCATLPEEEHVAADPLRQFLESERSRARTRMLRALDSEPTHRWLEALTAAAGGDAAGKGSDRAVLVMPDRVRRRFRKLRKSVGRLRGKSSMEDYHQVRRRAKQLRYAIECGTVLFGRPADELLKALRRLQDKLGAQQDAHMAQQRLAAIAAEPAAALPPATLFLMGRLAEQHARTTAQTRERLLRSWRKVRGRRWKSLRSRLGQLSDSAPTAGASAVAGTGPAEVSAEPVPAAGSTRTPESRQLKH